MDYKRQEIRAGLFILVGTLILVFFVFVLGDVKHLLKEHKNLTIIFDYTSGLQTGAIVRYAGLDVGRVTGISLSELPQDLGKDHIAVMTEIDPHINIKQDSRATIKTEGLMGAFYIDIRPGTRSGKILKVGEPLLGLDSFEFEEVGDMVTEVVVQIKRFTDLTEALIDDTRKTMDNVRVSLSHINQIFIDNKDSTRQSFDNLRRISAQLATLLEESSGDFKATLHHTRSITEKTDKILTGKETRLNSIIDQTDRLTRELELLVADNRPAMTNLIQTFEADSAELSSGLRSATVSIDQTMRQSNAILVENRRNLLETLKNLKATAANLKLFTENIKRNPWKLVRKSDELPPLSPAKTAAGPRHPLRMQRLDKVPD